MAVIIHRIVVVVDEIPAAGVIDEPVAVVVDSVPRYLSGIGQILAARSGWL
jgi:hypothetical protein